MGFFLQGEEKEKKTCGIFPTTVCKKAAIALWDFFHSIYKVYHTFMGFLVFSGVPDYQWGTGRKEGKAQR